MRHMLSKAVVLEAFSLMFDWHKTFPRKSEILMFIHLAFDQCSRGELYQCFDLHFLLILFTQCLFKQFCKKKWKLRCKYCILKWRVWKLHIHARVVNIFGSGFKKLYPVLSDLPISFKNASNFAKCKTFDRDKALIWFQYLQYLFLNTSVEIPLQNIR